MHPSSPPLQSGRSGSEGSRPRDLAHVASLTGQRHSTPSGGPRATQAPARLHGEHPRRLGDLRRRRHRLGSRARAPRRPTSPTSSPASSTSLTGKTTVLVHGTSITAARQAVAGRRAWPRRASSARSASSSPTPRRRRSQAVRSADRSDVRRGRRAADRVLPGDVQHRDPRRRGGLDAHRRRRQPAHRQGRQRRGHRLRRRPDPPLLQGGRRLVRRRRQPQGAVRAADRDLLGPAAAQPSSTPTPCRSAATAPTSAASSRVAPPR